MYFTMTPSRAKCGKCYLLGARQAESFGTSECGGIYACNCSPDVTVNECLVLPLQRSLCREHAAVCWWSSRKQAGQESSWTWQQVFRGTSPHVIISLMAKSCYGTTDHSNISSDVMLHMLQWQDIKYHFYVFIICGLNVAGYWHTKERLHVSPRCCCFLSSSNVPICGAFMMWRLFQGWIRWGNSRGGFFWMRWGKTWCLFSFRR